jgi:ketosteroid isomerase-like protein
MNARSSDLFDLWHPQMEWFWPDNTPGASVFRGHEEIAGGFAIWEESWEELAMEPKEILEDEDYALVITTYRMRGAGSGMYLEQELPHLYQFEGGQLRRWWIFGDAEKARRRFLAGDRPA